MVKPMAAQPRRNASLTLATTACDGASLERASELAELSLRIGGGALLQHAERRGIGVEAGVERELKMIMRIVSGRVRRETARRAVLETLIDRKDHHLAGAAQPPLHQHAGEVGLGPRVVAFIVAEDGFDGVGELHSGSPMALTRYSKTGLG